MLRGQEPTHVSAEHVNVEVFRRVGETRGEAGTVPSGTR